MSELLGPSKRGRIFWIYAAVFIFVFFLSVPAHAIKLDKVLKKATLDLKNTGGRECVHKAVGNVVEAVNCEIVGSGSHVSGLYVPGKSDHDFTMRVFGVKDERKLFKRWQRGRALFQKNIVKRTEETLLENVEAELDKVVKDPQKVKVFLERLRPQIRSRAKELARDFMKRTNLYPPPQLMAGVKSEAEAIARYKKLGAPPCLKYKNGARLSKKEWEAAAEGIYGEGGWPFIQNYENVKGKVWFKDPETGKARTGYADLVHMKEGFKKFTLGGMISNCRQWNQKIVKAIEHGDYRSAFKYVERYHENLSKARSLGRVKGPKVTGLRSYYDEYRRIQKQFRHLQGEARAKAVNEAIDKLFESEAYRNRFVKVIQDARREVELLERFSKTSNPFEKTFLADLLGKETESARRFWKEMDGLLSKVSLHHLLTAVFTAIDFRRSVSFAHGGKMDEAYRTAVEGVIGMVSGMTPAMAALVTNLILDWAKERGFAISVMTQDCEDLLAGIIEVKGWEKAESFGGGETNIEKLARNIAEEKRVRDIVETAIYNAAAGSGDSSEVKEGKKKALHTHCVEAIVTKWRNRRTEILGEYLHVLSRLSEAISAATGVFSVEPEPILLIKRRKGDKTAHVYVTAEMLGSEWQQILVLARQAKEKVERLGGRRRKVHLFFTRRVQWFLDVVPVGEPEERVGWDSPLSRKSFIFEKPGKHKVTCRVRLEARVLSDIRDPGDRVKGEYRILSAIFNLQMPGYYTWTERGDPLATYKKRTSLVKSVELAGVIDVKDSDLDDALKVVIDGPDKVLAGKTATLTAVLKSAVKYEPSALRFQWSEGVKPYGEMALFKAEKAGTYTVKVAVYKGKEKLAESFPFHLEVLGKKSAGFRLSIVGPSRARQGQDVALHTRTVALNEAGKLLLKGGNLYVAWFSRGVMLRTGPVGDTLYPDFPESGTYEVTAKLMQDGNDGSRVLAIARHRIEVVGRKKKEAKQTTGEGETPASGVEQKGMDNTQSVKEETGPPPCQYKYSPWGKCDRNTKIQRRRVIWKGPKGCVETSQPVLERSCTPPPTAEELKREYLNCLCRCYSGWAGHIGVWYDPEGKSIPECKSEGPCFGGAGAFGCTRRHFFGPPNECSRKCYESVYGKGTYDPAREDQMRKAINARFKKPLKVKIKASKMMGNPGDVIDLTAEVQGGTGGNVFRWGGCAREPKKDQAKVTFRQKCTSCRTTVTVIDQDGDKASASIMLKCQPYRIKLIKEGPASQTLPVGGKASFRVEVRAGKETASGSFIYLWEPSPEVLFGSPDNPVHEVTGSGSNRQEATFQKLGRTEVWVTVQKELDGERITLGRSNQVVINVVKPRVTLKAAPARPFAGDTVTVTAQEIPAMGDDVIDFWWETKGNVLHGGALSDPRQYSFVVGDLKPITITVHAKSKLNGDELGRATLILKARPYKVTVTRPKRLGPVPMVWDSKKGGLVPRPRAIAVFQDAEVTCKISPSPPEGVRYRWTVKPEGCTVSSPYSQETRLNASKAGSYQVIVEVTDKEDVVLGKSTTTFTVTISREQVNITKEKKKKREKALKLLQQAKKEWGEGKLLDKAIKTLKMALALDPKNPAVASQFKKWEREKARIAAAFKKVSRDIDVGKLKEASRILSAQPTHVKKYPPYTKLVEKLKAAVAQEKAKAQRLAQARKLRKEARSQWKRGEYKKAVATMTKAISLDPKNAAAKATLAAWKRKLKAFAVADRYEKEGALHEAADELEEAVKAYKKSLAIRPNKKLAVHVRALEKKIAERERTKRVAKNQGGLGISNVDEITEPTKKKEKNKKTLDIDEILGSGKKDKKIIAQGKKKTLSIDDIVDKTQDTKKAGKEKGIPNGRKKTSKNAKSLNIEDVLGNGKSDKKGAGSGKITAGDIEEIVGGKRVGQKKKTPSPSKKAAPKPARDKTPPPERTAPPATVPSPKGIASKPVYVATFTGKWRTNWGEMILVQRGNRVKGTYTHDKGHIKGVVRGRTLYGAWTEVPTRKPPNDAGDLRFTLSRDGKTFVGKWRYGFGKKEWDGTWSGEKISGEVKTPRMGVKNIPREAGGNALPRAPERTRYSSVYKPLCKGDVFNGGVWVGSRNNSDWLEKDFGRVLRISKIYIFRAGTDVTTRKSRLVFNLKRPDGTWVVVDELRDININ